jgi:hypothetical protein
MIEGHHPRPPSLSQNISKKRLEKIRHDLDAVDRSLRVFVPACLRQRLGWSQSDLAGRLGVRERLSGLGFLKSASVGRPNSTSSAPAPDSKQPT